MDNYLIAYWIALMVLAVIVIIAAFELWKYVKLIDDRIDQTNRRIQEVLTRLDMLDKSLGDLDISAHKGIEANKTRISEFKKEQNNRCDKIARRVESLEDMADNVESVGNLSEEVKSYVRRMKELDALVCRIDESATAISELAMSNQESIAAIQEVLAKNASHIVEGIL